jgi:circadian clock protein KaiC
MPDRVLIRRLPSGVPGLDAILGGGLPEFSFNLIAGTPGTGKTTLAQQIMFSLATEERRAIYFTALGELPIKLLRYQQQFGFFDAEKINRSVRYVNLAEDAMRGGLDGIRERILGEVEAGSPAIVMVDSFRTAVHAGAHRGDNIQAFVQQLGIQLTGCEATTFLIGEYSDMHREHNPVFTLADGVIWLYQTLQRSAVLRSLQVVKMRGQAQLQGLHTFRITGDGLRVFPRMVVGTTAAAPAAGGSAAAPTPRVSIGNQRLDTLLGGGIPEGYSLLLSGPSGSGKSTLATAFLEDGVRRGEAGVIALFEKRPRERAGPAAPEDAFARVLGNPAVSVIESRALDLSIDETLFELSEAVRRTRARRLVIDSLSGLELALAPNFREDFRESMYRLVSSLSELGVTVLMTADLEEPGPALHLSPHNTSFLADALIVQRWVEIEGELRRILAVVKVRGSAHSHRLHFYEITDDGVQIREPATAYSSMLSGFPDHHLHTR